MATEPNSYPMMVEIPEDQLLVLLSDRDKLVQQVTRLQLHCNEQLEEIRAQRLKLKELGHG